MKNIFDILSILKLHVFIQSLMKNKHNFESREQNSIFIRKKYKFQQKIVLILLAKSCHQLMYIFICIY